MALIGKDGSDGKEGDDNAAIRKFLENIDEFQPESLLPQHIRESRRFVQVTFVGSNELSEEHRRMSERYWQQALQYGLVDSRILHEDHDTIMVLSVCDREEAEEIVHNDPNISEGRMRPRFRGEMEFL